jgi:hypothetical protein
VDIKLLEKQALFGKTRKLLLQKTGIGTSPLPTFSLAFNDFGAGKKQKDLSFPHYVMY